MKKYERTGRKYSIEEVLSKRVAVKTPADQSYVDFDGDLIKMNSERYECFEVHGTDCSHCGAKGQYFVKEKSGNARNFHFNLYGVKPRGKEVLMTKGLVVSYHKGGKPTLDNRQTLCVDCNNEQNRNWSREQSETFQELTSEAIKVEDAKKLINIMNKLVEQDKIKAAAHNAFKVIQSFGYVSTIDREAIKCSFEHITQREFYLHVIDKAKWIADEFNLN